MKLPIASPMLIILTDGELQQNCVIFKLIFNKKNMSGAPNSRNKRYYYWLK